MSPKSRHKIRGLDASPTRLECDSNLVPRNLPVLHRDVLKRSTFRDTYNTVGVIGLGSHAQVWKAIHKPTNTWCAVKQLRKQVGFESKTYSSLAGFLRSLKHPHILDHVDFCEHKNHFFVATELCTPHTMLSLAEEQVTEAELAPILRQLLSALAYCHARGLAHRDVKPENVLLENGYVKLADFGCSARVTPDLEGVIGSPYYIAPEVLSGKYSVECDLWSCGVMMYMLLTRKLPYCVRTVKEVLEAARLKPFQPSTAQMKNLSESARSLLLRLLEVDPACRITASDAMEHPWVREHSQQAQ